MLITYTVYVYIDTSWYIYNYIIDLVVSLASYSVVQLQLIGKKRVCVVPACIHDFSLVAGTLCHNDAHNVDGHCCGCIMLLWQVDCACADGSEFGPKGITAFVLLWCVCIVTMHTYKHMYELPRGLRDMPILHSGLTSLEPYLCIDTQINTYTYIHIPRRTHIIYIYLCQKMLLSWIFTLL